MGKTANRLLLILLVGLLGLAGWVASGPYRAIHGIRQALEARDVAGLERHVDYPALRANVKAQIEDRIARQIGRRFGAQAAGGMASGIAGMLSDNAVDAMVSPAGIALLLQGRALRKRLSGESAANGGPAGAPPPFDPLKNARTRFESPSRFFATVNSADGEPVEFLFERQGMNWRLTDIRLPPPGG